ncbi:MAG: VOC family protein [Lachnospiraceae bacterium]|jgi:4-hydroxyphenylpyruvate dioxygenase-like putative hemolysin|nr:VOC family protein [Lachnospiraceae bacterium]
MAMGVVDGKTICQVALVVKDLEKSSKAYAQLFGVPVPKPFSVPPQSEAHTQFKGEPTDTRAMLAVFDLGQVVLELTQPDDEPSSWKDFLDTHGEGIHHIAFMTKDREPVVKYFEENGMPVRHYGEYEGGNYTVFDSKGTFGTFIQVKEDKNLGG